MVHPPVEVNDEVVAVAQVLQEVPVVVVEAERLENLRVWFVVVKTSCRGNEAVTSLPMMTQMKTTT